MVPSNVLSVAMLLAEPSTPAVAEQGVTAEPPAAEPASVEPVRFEPAPMMAEPAPTIEPMPEDAPPNTRWRGGPYLTLGLAPMATMDVHAAHHPGLRYDLETGLAWKRGRMRVYVGPDLHLLQYFGRKKVGFGVDGVATVSLRHVYARAGLGTSVGMPASADVRDTRPMVGGLVGGGLVGRLDDVEGRLGVDYDVRVDTSGRVAQTVLLTLRMTFGP